MSERTALERRPSAVSTIHPALRVGAVDDPAEVEADAMADRVMAMTPGRDPGAHVAGRTVARGASTIRRACGCGCGGDNDEVRRSPAAGDVVRRAGSDEEDELQMKPAASAGDVVRRAGSDEEDELQMKPAAAAGDVVRREAPDDEEDELQMKPARAQGGGLAVGADLAERISARRGGGSGLSTDARSFFEPRFGVDLSRVRVHRGAEPAALAGSVSARAFTVGQDVFLGAGEGSFATAEGRRLIAHELTHTLQARGPTVGTIRRRVHPTRSSCPASVHSAPTDPIAALTTLDADAERMALGASGVLFLEALTRNDPTFGPSAISTAFTNRFGPPQALSNGRFRTRFTGNRTFGTRGEALSAGMLGLAARFDRVARFLTRNIDYDCPGTANKTIGSCRDRCAANNGAWVCVGGPRNIAICPGFWNSANDQQRAGMIVHEVAHLDFGIRNHNSGNQAQRRSNPECYTSFLADINGFSTWDQRCPI